MSPRIPTSTLALVLSKFGPLKKVLSFSTIDLPRWNESSVFIKFLASPINPSDINAIQGSYPIKPAQYDPYFLPGFEGVARVAAVGEKVKDLQPGDLVLPGLNPIGTWRSSAICAPEMLFKIPESVPIHAASMISVNPPTALKMLTKFVTLSPGSTIIQNAANSAVGQAVIQIAKLKGIQTINIIRESPTLKETKKYLKEIGANYILTEDELVPFMKNKKFEIPLALNAVGGESSYELAKCLSAGGIHVTYGGLSNKPVMLPTGSLIFKDIQPRGFWMSEWKKTHSKQEISSLYSEILEMIANGNLQMPAYQEISFEKAASDKEATFLQMMTEFSGPKKIFVFDQ